MNLSLLSYNRQTYIIKTQKWWHLAKRFAGYKKHSSLTFKELFSNRIFKLVALSQFLFTPKIAYINFYIVEMHIKRTLFYDRGKLTLSCRLCKITLSGKIIMIKMILHILLALIVNTSLFSLNWPLRINTSKVKHKSLWLQLA